VIAYAPAAQIGRAYFLRSNNTIDVYVEDSSLSNAYIRHINKVLGRRGSVGQVYPLGSRAEVEARCALMQGPGSRSSLFLIDADLDLLLGKRPARMRNLCRLNAYCFENLVIQEGSVLAVAMECATSRSPFELENSIDLTALLSAVTHELIPLFVLYAVAIKAQVSIETVGYSVIRFLRDPNDPSSISRELVRSRMFGICRTLLRAVSAGRIRSDYVRIRARAVARGALAHTLVSGKSYLLPLVRLRLRQTVSLQDRPQVLVARLVSHCGPTLDRQLTRKIRSAARARSGASSVA
jgi:hypothetical protein